MCSASESLSIVRKRCQYQRSCLLHAGNLELGDPCRNAMKYLKFEYNCTQGWWDRFRLLPLRDCKDSWKEESSAPCVLCDWPYIFLEFDTDHNSLTPQANGDWECRLSVLWQKKISSAIDNRRPCGESWDFDSYFRWFRRFSQPYRLYISFTVITASTQTASGKTELTKPFGKPAWSLQYFKN